jgi:hypothetical protein
MMPQTPAMGRPKATAAMLAVMGCISSSTPTAGTRPMLIANTGLNYRVWLRDGLESRTFGACARPGLPIVPVASCPQESVVRATILGGIYGI